MNIECLCWEGVDIDGEALRAILFEGDGWAQVGAEERTSIGVQIPLLGCNEQTLPVTGSETGGRLSELRHGKQ